MPSLGAPELLIILAIVVVLFGASRIGDIGKGVGRGIREFRSELKGSLATDEEEQEVVAQTASNEPRSTQSH